MKRKICVAHPGLRAGGSEARVMALLEALQNNCDVTLLTSIPFECDRLNVAYHTKVRDDKVKVRIAPIPAVLKRVSVGDALRSAYYSRFVKEASVEFDLCISCFEIMHFEGPSIQFLIDVTWSEELKQKAFREAPGIRRIFHTANAVRTTYLYFAKMISGTNLNGSDRLNCLFVANSSWIADMFFRGHGIKPIIIYPPVYAPDVVEEYDRTSDFVLLGRISPEKRVVEAIEVIRGVRDRGHNVNLHIIGAFDASSYSEHVRKVSLSYEWVYLHGGLFGPPKFAELAKHSFGIHMRFGEAFGIAVAEMVKMGLVPFVPDDAGPSEIVGDERLTFSDQAAAVEVIDNMLQHPQLLSEIRLGLKRRGALFSSEKFKKEAEKVIFGKLS